MAARAPRQSPAVTRTPASPTQSGPQVDPSLEPPGAAQAPGLDTQLERANRLGHHFEQLPSTARPPPRTAAANGLPGSLKNGLERLSGMDLSDVRVHYGSSEPTRMEAFASTRGNTIHLAPGQEHHLPHEGWHVVQQRQGRVRATAQRQGNALNTDESLEQEADVMGSKASSPAPHAPVGGTAPMASSAPAPGAATGSVSQLQPWRRAIMRGGMGGYTAFMAHNAYRQHDIAQNPQNYQDDESRLAAVNETRRGAPGSVAWSMYPPVSALHLLAGNVGGGSIGGFYRRNRNLLEQAATPQNIRTLANHETHEYFARASGVPYAMGSLLTAEQRAAILEASARSRRFTGF